MSEPVDNVEGFRLTFQRLADRGRAASEAAKHYRAMVLEFKIKPEQLGLDDVLIGFSDRDFSDDKRWWLARRDPSGKVEYRDAATIPARTF